MRLARVRINKSLIGFIILIGVGLFAVRFSTPGRNALTPVEIWFRDILAPLQSGVTTVTRFTGTVVNNILSFKDLQAENEALRGQIERLTEENNQLEEYRQQNLRLRQLLRLEKMLGSQFELEAAEVIARDIKNWNQSLTINKGSRHGLKKGMAVITHQGLVGRISAVSENTAEVLLILDRQGAVAGLLQASRFPGVVEGTTDDSGLLQMIHLPYDAPVRENQVVVTSGLGQVIPKGLRIGYVVGIKPEPNGLMKRALIKPFADLDRLEEVMVVKAVKGGM